MAIIVYLMTWIPFWNSLDAVRRIHSDLELSSIIFFALLALFDGLAHWAKDRSKERRFAEIGVWCFVIAVICEGVAYPYGQRNDTLSERVIVSLDAKATHASEKAAKALADSAEAINKAGQAAGKSDIAQSKADGALKEADAYAREIASAKEGSAVAVQKAADAVSRLAEAEQRLADATQREATAEAALSAIKTPRTLRNIPGFIAALKPFAGTEYTFASVFSDKESIDLLIEIDKILTEAGWKRVKPPAGFPAINVYGKDVDFSVVSSLEDGTRVTVESQSSVESIQATPPALRPLNINAGLALNVALSEGITPPQKGANTPAHLEKGDSKVIVIMIGKKQ